MTQKDVWWWALLAVIAFGVLAHSMLPRYEWRTVEKTGSVSVVVYDRWTGRMQRAVYTDNGDLNVMGVYTPF